MFKKANISKFLLMIWAKNALILQNIRIFAYMLWHLLMVE